MRLFLPLLALIGLVGCGGGPPRGSEAERGSTDLTTYDVQEDARTAGPPAISPTAAPGVAFNYRYAFRLPAERISAVQEQHAAACEKLGIERCRITGMLYRVVNERDIQAMLAFKLDPALARRFGKMGVESVSAAEGMLIESEITGEDVQTQIDSTTRSQAQMEEELRRIEGQLARPGLGATERTQLQSQAQQLRDSIRSAGAARTERQEALARTPVVFNYGSGDLVPGFDTHRPFRDALKQASENFVEGLAWMLVIFVTLLPWALAALIGVAVWRRLRRKWPARARSEIASEGPPLQGEGNQP